MIKIIYPNKYVDQRLLAVRAMKEGAKFGDVRHRGFGVWICYKGINHVCGISGIFIFVSHAINIRIDNNFVYHQNLISMFKALWSARRST